MSSDQNVSAVLIIPLRFCGQKRKNSKPMPKSKRRNTTESEMNWDIAVDTELVMVVLGAANCAAGAGAEGLLDSMTQGLDANKENRV